MNAYHPFARGGRVVASIAPDLDVVAFRFGISYADDLGHRGFSHSLFVAVVVALAAALAFRTWHATRGQVFWFVFVAAASHGILDAFTNGGLGVAFFWPWSGERYFAPIQVIEVSPLGIRPFFTERGAWVLGSELLWVWVPSALLATLLMVVRRARANEGGK